MSKITIKKNLSEVWVQYPHVGEKYNHYKGGRYEIITLAQHTEREEEVLVIYKSLLYGTVYARPLNMWFDDIEIIGDFGEYDTKRFVKMG